MSIATPRELWMGYCEAVSGIRERFGLANAIDYVVGEKLMTFSQMTELRALGVACYMDVVTDEVRKASRSHAFDSPSPGECRSTNGPANRRTVRAIVLRMGS